MNTNTNQVLQTVADEVVNKANILSYLDVVKNNVNLSALNQAMVYLQKPTASFVCGRMAWKGLRREPNPDAVPIVLFFPQISVTCPPREFTIEGVPLAVAKTDVPILIKEAEYNSDYLPVNAYDLDSTFGNDYEPGITLPDNIMDDIISITQCTPEFVDRQSIGGNDGMYKRETNTFYFSDSINLDTLGGREKYRRTALGLYIDYIFDTYNITDVCLKYAVRYVLYERYHLQHQIAAPLFLKLGKKEAKERIDFLFAVNFITNKIVQDLEGYFLNFDETAFINDLLISSEYPDMWMAFDKAAISITDEMLIDEMEALKEKLMRSVDGYLEDILELKLSERLYTFPPQPIILDNIDYLRKERLRFLNLDM